MTTTLPKGARPTPQCEFFVLRAPLLPLEALARWTDGVAATGACADGDHSLERALEADRALLRTRLAAFCDDEHVADGLVLSSPDLADAVARWRLDPTTKGARSAERSLVRYVTRVASRPDLFGLAGAYSVGRFGEQAALELPPASELGIRARVDSGLLREVVRRAANEAATDLETMVKCNSGTYRAGGRLRVAARKAGSTEHRLVAVRPTPTIDLALASAREGISIGDLVGSLEAEGVDASHALEVIRRLVASELLVVVADVTVTGPEPAAQAREALASLPRSEVYAEAVRRAVAALSRSPRIGRDAIDAVSEALAPTGVAVNRRRCISVDARRPGVIRLPETVLHEMRRSIELLAKISPPTSGALESFKESFERRFATRHVPLLEALDPDCGIRLSSGLDAPPESAPAGPASRRRTLMMLIERLRSAPRAAVELTDADIAGLSADRPAVLPAAFAMLTSIVARDAAAIERGAFELVEPTINGPSGARLLGRLCQGDPELTDLVCEHLEREAALNPDVVLAEMSVAPETEVGLNITQRPLLRDWEIDYGGRSGAPAGGRLTAADLMVSVEDGQVVLRSLTLDRPIVPCSTTAMNPLWLSLPAARFMLSIGHQRVAGNLGWSWDEFADAPSLPRVTRGNVILALRRWNVAAAELREVRTGGDAPGFRRLQKWRLERDLPRVVAFDHPKSRMIVDLGNALSVDAFLAASRDFDLVRLVEVAALDCSPVRGPDGHYAHELVVPFTLEPERGRTMARRGRPRPVSEPRRRFPPGSEWLYVNLYGPIGSADRVLVDHVGPLVRSLRQAGSIDRWFFIRYADPGRHLRVRFHGRPRDLLADALPALHEAMASPLAEGLLYRISIDTYEREIERYGGLEGVELMEQVAEVDSDAAIDILGNPLGAVGRRHLAVASVAALYADAGLSLEARRECCVRLRTTWATGPRALGARLAVEEREERAALEEIVAGLERDDGAPAVAALRKRSPGQEPILRRLRGLDDESLLEQPFNDVMCSLAHMAVNRLLKRGANHDELRVHDALARIYEAQLARRRMEVA